MTFARRRVGSLTIRGDRARQTMLGKEPRGKFGAGLAHGRHGVATVANRDRLNENFNFPTTLDTIQSFPAEDGDENYATEDLARQSVEFKRTVQTCTV